MLNPSLFEQLRIYAAGASIVLQMNGELLALLAEECLAFGAAVVGLKLGDQGLYLRTTSDQQRLVSAGRGLSSVPPEWLGRELLAPCFQARVVGTTGAGDATIAGLLASLLFGSGPEAALRDAVAVGAYSVEAADANSAVPPWRVVQQRIASGWPPAALSLSLVGWRLDDASGIWRGPSDRHASE